ncbi:MAG: low molecular weight phosphotyrosine protein phosphatase [Bdellovibrionales bacterium]|nr:low molecular weight phosphotyrosine protein phosphatase [Bdellovibrionales bacterium]
MKKALFICLGNICRSPAAEGIMQSKIQDHSLDDKIQCDSAGTIGHHAGELPDSRMRKAAKARGYILDSHSRKFEPSVDFAKFDYLIVMDDSNLQDIKILDKKLEFKSKLFKLTDFSSNKESTFVPDPYFGGQSGFDLVLDLVEDCTENLLLKIKDEL